MAIKASKGAVAAAAAGVVAEAVVREARSVVDPPRRSPALAFEEEEADWIWEAAKRLYLFAPASDLGCCQLLFSPRPLPFRTKKRIFGGGGMCGCV